MKAIATVGDVKRWLEELAPPELAEEWDRVGLQAGDPAWRVEKAITALTVTDDVIDQAARAGASLIVAHHPLIFRPLERIDPAGRVGRLVTRLIKEGIALIVAHTNLDSAAGGVNDGLAERLQLGDVSPLVPRAVATELKLVTFIPHEHVERVREALAAAGAGVIGRYSHCTFGVAGEGTFLPREGASPFVGAVGEIERVSEVRLEVVVARSLKGRVVQALKESHPYEEVAFDLYPLEPAIGESAGLGRVGNLSRPMSTEEFAKFVKKVLSLDHVRLAGSDPGEVRRVAVVGGSGGGFLHAALAAGADALVTGDVDYHDADEARHLGLLVVDGGHFGTEKHVPVDLAHALQERARLSGSPLEIEAAQEIDAFWLPGV